MEVGSYRALFSLIGLVATLQVATTSAAEGWRSVENEFGSLWNQERCAEAWALIWRWAKSGDVDARGDLGRVVGYFDPPGLNTDIASRHRHVFTFAIHGIVGGDPVNLDHARLVVDGLRMTRAITDPYYQCFEAVDRPACLQGLVSSGRVADFDRYARELDMMASADGATPAKCYQIHGSQRKEGK